MIPGADDVGGVASVPPFVCLVVIIMAFFVVGGLSLDPWMSLSKKAGVAPALESCCRVECHRNERIV